MNRPLSALIEALLFVSGEPLKLTRLGALTDASKQEVAAALLELRERYQSDRTHGLMLIEHDGAVELATIPEAAEAVARLGTSALQGSLSKAALEVLAIVAYRAPLTRSEIESIRGVNCSFTLRTLLLRGLIEREEVAGERGFVYKPTFALLEKLGLNRLEDLPDYTLLRTDSRLTPVTVTGNPSPTSPSDALA